MQDWLKARTQASPDKIAIIEHPTPTYRNEISYRHLNAQVEYHVPTDAHRRHRTRTTHRHVDDE